MILSSVWVRVPTVLNTVKVVIGTSVRSMGKQAKWNEEKERKLNLSGEERRKEYFCEGEFVKLEDIKPWSEVCQKEAIQLEANDLKNVEEGLFGALKIDESLTLSEKVSIFEGDITTLEIDAIVNAANNSLLGGGGVDGAIHRAAGPMLLAENRDHQGCQDGEAVESGGYRLPAKYVISTVGPRGEHPEVLQRAYGNCLTKMLELGLKTIAFPCISTGIYGYPNHAACNIALRTSREFLEEHHQKVERIIFCLFLPRDVKLYKERLSLMFPASKDEEN